jgi:hypothetical protein
MAYWNLYNLRGIMSDHSEKAKQGKHQYQKPELKIIELAAEEVLGGGCKTWGGAGGVGEGFDCGITANCALNGS